jgi:predicted RNase H-like HicB family nuclease
MNNKLNIEYPAFIYKKNKVFIANCVLFNLTTFGKSENEAVQNLQKSMQANLNEFTITIKPIYEEYQKPATNSK